MAFASLGQKSTEELLEESRDEIQKLQTFIDNMMKGSSFLGTVAALSSKRAVVSTPRGLVEVPRHEDIELEVGTSVRLAPDAGIMGLGYFTMKGPQASVVEDRGTHALVKGAGDPKLLPKHVELGMLETGDSVFLDIYGNVIIEKEESTVSFVPTSIKPTTWADIGGLHNAKQTLKEIFEDPYEHQDLYKFFDKSVPKGVLLYGSPGNGKTLLARAVANVISSNHTDSPDAFISIKGPEVLSKWVGEAEKTIRNLFLRGNKHYAKTGKPAVLFIDEADALLGQRGRKSTAGMESTVVPQFLSEMDGLKESNVVVILATNHANDLDSAVIREGRVDRKVYVERPNPETAKEILSIYLKKVPTVDSLEVLTEAASSRIFCRSQKLRDLKTEKGTVPFLFSHIVSGAMLASVVEQATQLAIHRNKGKASHEFEGLRTLDMATATERLINQNKRLEHREAARELLEHHVTVN